jgi:hypothetical protein
MKLTFPGTRGFIEVSRPRGRMHAALLVGYRRHWIMIDCEESWRGRFAEWAPEAIVPTHAHGVAAAIAYDGMEGVLR